MPAVAGVAMIATSPPAGERGGGLDAFGLAWHDGQLEEQLGSLGDDARRAAEPRGFCVGQAILRIGMA